MHPARNVRYGIVIAGMFCCVLLCSRPAAAQGAYFNGTNVSLSNVCPITGTFEPAATTTFTGYFTNPATNLPSTGDTVYIHAYAGNLSACSGDVVGFDFFLPDGASLDISSTNPVYCIRGRFDNSIVENVPTDANGACSQTPGPGNFGGYFFGWSALPNVGNWWLEIRVPVRFNKQLLGLAGPTTHQIQVGVSSIHGTAVPVQAVTVFYRARFDAFATNGITSSTATPGFNLWSYFHSGTLFVDYGTTNPPPQNGSATAIPNSSIGFTITNPLSGLSPGTTYFWRARYVTTDGTFTSAVQSFATTGGSPQTLTVTKSGTGAGTVTSNPAGINCGGTCSASFSFNSGVTLTAAASSGSTFTGWSGGGCSGTGTCSVTMSAAQTVNAQFTAAAGPFTVSVTKAGTGAGTVTSNPAGINCGGTCSASFSSGSVTLTATPNSGSNFAGWSGGGCSGTGTCTLASSQSVTAQFTRQIGSLSITLGGLPAGTTAALAVSGPDGYNTTQTLTTGFGVNLSDVVTGSYTVTPPTKTVGSATYTAPPQSATVNFGTTATINIVYTLQTTSQAKTADFDGDGKSEMVAYKPWGVWTILKSSAGFGASMMGTVGGPGTVPVPGDYDGDGKIDPAAYNLATGQWVALKSSTNYATSFTQTWGGGVPEPGDYDGDGKADLAIYVEAAAQWKILKSSSGYASSMTVSWGGVGYTPVPGCDFDGDGKADITVYKEATGGWHVLKSSTNFTGALNVAWGGRGYTLVPGDYDGDGKADLGLYQRATGTWLVLKSGAGFTTTLNQAWGGLAYEPVPGDYDGDGKLDLGVFLRATGAWYILKSSAAYTTSLSVAAYGAPTDTVIPGAIRVGRDDMRRATDVDGDGKADITVYNASVATWYTLTSTSTYNAAANRAWGGAAYAIAPGDFDGDGQLDYGAYKDSTGTFVVLLSGAGFTTSINKVLGGAGFRPLVGDYDGDGKSDLAVYNGTTAQWLALTSSSNFTATIAVAWGGPGFTPVPADYDGDGKTDIGVYQASSGTWYVLLAAANFTTSLTKAVGGSAWSPVPGDYDGDGKADFVVYNGTTAQWYGLKSSTNYTTTVNVMWGGPGYTPVQGDYDGDGKVDLAMYTSAGAWSILQSSSNYTTTISKSWGAGAAYVPVPKYP